MIAFGVCGGILESYNFVCFRYQPIQMPHRSHFAFEFFEQKGHLDLATITANAATHDLAATVTKLSDLFQYVVLERAAHCHFHSFSQQEHVDLVVE
jgi:hypothetical protein